MRAGGRRGTKVAGKGDEDASLRCRERLPAMRRLVAGLVLALVTAVAGGESPAPLGAAAPKVLRYSFRIAETGFDPAQISDLYSSTITANLFEAPYQYEFLARPARLRPATAAAMPEISDDFKTFVVRLKPGIHFIDDPVFGGKPRELVAADYVYTIKRIFDPRWKSPHLSTFEEDKILGLDALRKEALAGKPFDYDREIPGLRALDRYTLQFKLGAPTPRFADHLSDAAVVGAVAREVVEAN